VTQRKDRPARELRVSDTSLASPEAPRKASPPPEPSPIEGEVCRARPRRLLDGVSVFPGDPSYSIDLMSAEKVGKP
jgi:hypothetical protein